MAFHEERALELTRTLMIVGFNDEDELKSFKDSVFDSNKMAEFYIVHQTNILFLIFYDVRESSKFFNSLKHSHLKVTHTISKYELPRRMDECGEKNLQSSINLLFKDLDVAIEDDFILNFLKQYGEIRELRNSKPTQKTVEFYDIRSARKAYSALHESLFGTGEIRCRWVWDLSLTGRSEYLRLTDEFIKKYISMDNKEVRTVKRIKIDVSSKRNPVLALFDQFIGENISEIEKMLK